mgnify:CR=1 FL=1
MTVIEAADSGQRSIEHLRDELEPLCAAVNPACDRLLDTLRADLVKQYLAETDFRLEQISYLVGYSEPAALGRAFRRWTGTTPAAYRAQHAR